MQANNWDDKYRDHAWSEMRKLLDDELPVAAIPWWRKWGLLALLLLFLVPLAGSALWYILGSETPLEETVLEPVANTPTKTSTSPNDAAIANEVVSSEAAITPSSPTIASAAPNSEAASADVPPSQEQKTNTTPKPAELELIPIIPTQEAVTPSPQLNERTFELPLDLLPAGPIAALNEEPTLPGLDLESLEPISNQLQWGLSGSIQVGNFPGAAGGIAIRENIGNTRWSWQSGVEVLFQRFLRNDEELLALADELETPIDVNDTTIMDLNSYAENLSFGAGPRKLYYLGLSVPVTMAYRIGPAVRLNAGIRARYLLTSGTQPKDVFTGNKSVSDDLFLTNGAAYIQTPLYAQYNRQRFGLAATAGLEWQLGSQWSASGQFLFGVLDENKTKDGFQNRMAGEVRLSYFFNRPTRQ